MKKVILILFTLVIITLVITKIAIQYSLMKKAPLMKVYDQTSMDVKEGNKEEIPEIQINFKPTLNNSLQENRLLLTGKINNYVHLLFLDAKSDYDYYHPQIMTDAVIRQEAVPEMGLSPSKTHLLYKSKEGIKEYNLKTQEKTLIIENPSSNDIKDGLDINFVDIAIPSYSPLGTYITHEKRFFEGSSFSVLNRETKDVYLVKSGYHTWSNDERILLQSFDNVGYTTPGLLKYDVSNDFKEENLNAYISKGNDIAFVGKTTISSDNTWIAFPFKLDLSESNPDLGLFNLNTKEFEVIAKNAQHFSPLFSSDDTLYFLTDTENAVILNSYEIETKKTTSLVQLSAQNDAYMIYKKYNIQGFTKEGHIVIKASNDMFSQIIILDKDDFTLVYQSPMIDDEYQFIDFISQ